MSIIKILTIIITILAELTIILTFTTFTFLTNTFQITVKPVYIGIVTTAITTFFISSRPKGNFSRNS